MNALTRLHAHLQRRHAHVVGLVKTHRQGRAKRRAAQAMRDLIKQTTGDEPSAVVLVTRPHGHADFYHVEGLHVTSRDVRALAESAQRRAVEAEHYADRLRDYIDERKERHEATMRARRVGGMA